MLTVPAKPPSEANKGEPSLRPFSFPTLKLYRPIENIRDFLNVGGWFCVCLCVWMEDRNLYKLSVTISNLVTLGKIVTVSNSKMVIQKVRKNESTCVQQ